MYNLLDGYGLDNLGRYKHLYLTVPVTFGPVDSIDSASVPSPHFYTLFIIEALRQDVPLGSNIQLL